MTGGVFVEMVVTGHRTPDTGDHQSLAVPGHNVHKQWRF